MTKRQAVETLDRSLQDIMDCSDPFGGKVVVLGGDFRQVLLVVSRGTRAQITDATLQRSHVWDKIHKIRLSQNMRAQSDPVTPEFEGKLECINYMCARIKLHTRNDSVNIRYSAKA
jgi:hypothetical protein